MTEITDEKKTLQRLKDRAARLLATRDHSEHELRNKLMRTDFQDDPPAVSTALVAQVIDWCYEHQWLNDKQFAERYIASRARKGYGPQRIQQELAQKGIVRTLVKGALAVSEVDWSAAAFGQVERKFGLPLPKSFPEKARLQRFLLYRGYYMEDIQDLYRNFSE